MSDVELAQTNNDTLMLPVTSACLVLAYNLPNFHGELRLSRKAYPGIFLGDIKKWNDPLIAQSNPGVTLPNQTIAIATRQDASGTTFAFTNNLSAINDRWRSLFGAATLVNWPGNVMRAKGNEGVSALIQKSEGSIGYVGYEFANRSDWTWRRSRIRMASLSSHPSRVAWPDLPQPISPTISERLCPTRVEPNPIPS